MGSRHTAVIFAALLFLSATAGRGAGEAGPGKLIATYDAGLAGISLGEFKVTASIEDGAYEMAAAGEFSLLAGLIFSATGKTTSSGTLTSAAVEPAQFSFDYDGGKKREQRRMRFTRGAVSDIKIVPRKKPSRHRVPVGAAQLKDVLDPLTGAFLSVRSDAPAGDPEICGQTIPVFDGTQRFDLVLTPKGTGSLGSGAPRGLADRVAVCRVRYRPISGHRPDHPGVQFMSKTEEIEVWLVPVPRMGLYVPYKIQVPTTWGTGSVTLTGLKTVPGR
jgi:uncharacterized protein DUF3108